MNGLLKVILAVAVLMVVLAGAALWFNAQKDSGKQLAQQEAAGPTMAPEIPQPLEQVALEEYAIEFEGAPRIAADVELCNIVKDQCKTQGIRNCEDYEMCLSGISGQE